MSIKDLFTGQRTYKITTSSSMDTLGDTVESAEYLEAYAEDRQRFVPAADFGNPSQFAFYGSAEEYYRTTIERIHNTYPYDGSRKEKLQWHNSSSYLDNWFFDNEYPRTHGYVTLGQNQGNASLGSITTSTAAYRTSADADATESFSITPNPQFIHIKGGPHGPAIRPYDSETIEEADFKNPLHKANIFDQNRDRESNLLVHGASGSTVEFWFKAGGTATNNAKFLGNSKCLGFFDLWNSGSIEAGSAYSGSYGRLLVEMRRDSSEHDKLIEDKLFYVTCLSGSSGFERVGIGSGSLTGSNPLDEWNHFAFTMKNKTSDMELKFYLNGELQDTVTTGSTIGMIRKGPHIANLGAYIHAPTTASAAIWGEGATISYSNEGIGSVSGSFDEFRFWKERRTSQQIKRYFNSQVGGGVNTDEANKHLGVYYKFNEGITQTGSVDQNVLDYSGRISNGAINNYNKDLSMRSTGSAIVEKNADATEFKDPIIYSYHPEVLSTLEQYEQKGATHDHSNVNLLYHSIPSWIIEEDEKSETILQLFQVMSSYFDTLHLQIQNLPRLKDHTFRSGSYDKPLPFADQLLESAGFFAPEIFPNATVLEQFMDRDDDGIHYEKKLHDTKNFIYENIYNNLAYINKSKGTTKSLRNLMRCFGVDDELYKINFYADNTTFKPEDSYNFTSVRKSYADFNRVDRNDAVVFQSTSSVAGTSGYINGSAASTGYDSDIGTAYEAEFLFPAVAQIGDPNEVSASYGYISASMFGVHTALSSSANLTWATDDVSNFQVYAVRDQVSTPNSPNAYFQLTSTTDGIMEGNEITSSLFYDVYDNQKWNFLVNVKPRKYPNSTLVSGSADDYIVDFRGVSMVGDIVAHEFHVTASVRNSAGKNFMTSDRRMYVGAHRTNFAGTVITPSNVKASGVRNWMIPLERDELVAHARDATNYGVSNPYQPAYLTETRNLHTGLIPKIETLALHWDFTNVAGSDAAGEFIVTDLSSGSDDSTFQSSKYGNLSAVLCRQHPGQGMFFPATDSGSISREYISTAKTQMLENLNNESFVQVLAKDDQFFGRRARPVRYFFSVEKSMYQSISDEMIDFFANAKGMSSYSNMIGEPVNKYRPDYKSLQGIKSLFFDKVNNTPDLEKYTKFYKWFDDSVSAMILNLVPATSDFSGVRNVVESHMFERNKYQHKFPTLDMKHDDPSGSIKAIGELKYNWRFGHAPILTSPAVASTATITVIDSSAVPGVPYIGNGDTIQMISTDGTTVTLTMQGTGGSTTSTSTSGTSLTAKTLASGSYADSSLQATAQAVEIRTAINHHTLFTATNSANVITVTQNTAGAAGNTTVTKSELGATGMTNTNFTGGKDRDETGATEGNQSNNTLWWKQKAEKGHRAPSNLNTGNEGVDRTRGFIHSASSQKIDRDFSRPYSFSMENFRREGPKNYRSSFAYLVPGSSRVISMKESDVSAALAMSGNDDEKDLFPPRKLKAALYGNLGGEYYNNLFPFNMYSSSLETSITTYFKEGLIMTDHHRDTYHTFENEPLQGPFTETHVGGNQHRHFAFGEAQIRPIATLSIVNHSAKSNGQTFSFQDGAGNTYSATVSAATAYNAGNKTTIGIGGVSSNRTMLLALYYSLRDAVADGLEVKIGKFVGGASESFSLTYNHVNATDASYLTSPAGTLLTANVASLPSFEKESQGQPTLNSHRPEGWRLTFDTEDGEKKLNLKGGTAGGADIPRATMLRSETAKRPVNIKNINYTTSSFSIGNFNKNYEVVMTSGRNINNHYFVENMGVSVTGSQSTVLSGNVDFALPDRTQDKFKTRSIIAERFSAPGDPSTLSRGYLDTESESFAPNNALPWRNMSVRHPLRTMLSASSGQFGLNEGYSFPSDAANDSLNPVASFHKINRNSATRVELRELNTAGAPASSDSDTTQADDNNYTTNTQSDNWYVQHQIPQSVMQYSWITASAESGPYGFERPDFSNASFASTDITFVSASDFGSFVAGDGNRKWGETKAVSGSSGFVFTDFAGLNLTITEPVTSSDNHLGFESGVHLARSQNDSTNTQYLARLDKRDEYGTGFILGGSGGEDELTNWDQASAHAFNALMLHRNGPYGYPSWKQLRIGDHPVARYHKNNNIISTLNVEKVETQFDAWVQSNILSKHQLLQITQAPVTSKYRPVVHEVVLKDKSGADIKSTYGNDLHQMLNQRESTTGVRFLDIIGIKKQGPTPNVFEGRGETTHDQMRRMYITREISDEANPLNVDEKPVDAMIYREVVWPKEENSYLKKVRSRNNWDQSRSEFSTDALGQQRTFWKSDLHDRVRQDKDTTLNSMGIGIDKDSTKGFPSSGSSATTPYTSWHFASGGILNADNLHLDKLGLTNTTVSGSGGSAALSVWPLDTDGKGGAVYAYDSPNEATPTTEAGNAIAYFLGRGNGELTNSDDWSLYYRDHAATASICYDYVQLCVFSGAVASSAGSDDLGNINKDAKLPKYQTNTLIGVDPWFNSYEDYAEDIRLMAQGYSLLPEFKLSDHMQYYLDSGGFIGKNNAYLEIEGASTTVSASAESPQGNINSEFYNTFCETSPMTHLKMLQTEHAMADPVMKPNRFTVSFDGIMKLLPYQGFYPVLRTVQLATMFSQSYGPYIGAGDAKPGGSDENNWPAKPDGLRNQATRTAALMQPWFSPGIMFNTIKSGIAVDWATYKGHTTIDSTSATNSYRGAGFISSSTNTDHGGPNFRLPFESLFNPDQYIPVSGSSDAGRIPHLGPQWTSYYTTSGSAHKPLAGGVTEPPSVVFTFTGVSSNGRKIGFESPAGTKITGTVDSSTATSTPTVIGTSGASTAAVMAQRFYDFVRHRISGSTSCGQVTSLFAEQNNSVVTLYAHRGPSWNGSDVTNGGGTLLDNVTIAGGDGNTADKFSGGQDANLSFFDWSGDSKPYYSLAMHNFLAEVPNFFLNEGQYTTFVSSPQSEFVDFKGGEKYYMDVVLRKNKDMVMYEGPAAFQFPGTSLNSTGSSRGMHYGPNAMWTNESLGAEALGPAEEYKRNIADPAPAPWTPPYFYGTSIARFEFDPLSVNANLGTSVQAFTLDEIFQGSSIEYINLCERHPEFAQTSGYADGGLGISKLGVDTDEDIAKTYSGSVGTPASASFMHLSSSMNLIGKSNPGVFKFAPDSITGKPKVGSMEPGDDPAWVISPKFECPVMNFSGNAGPAKRTAVGSLTEQQKACFDGMGMWKGSGSIPQGENGIWMELRESFPTEVLKPGSSKKSLIEAVGFNTEQKRIGRIAQSKTISEAIVAIPYQESISSAGKKIEFFHIDQTAYNTVLSNTITGKPDVHSGQLGLPPGLTVGKTSIGEMIDKMKKYVIPPWLDFSHPDNYDPENPQQSKLSPFVMYIMEFTHTLDREDLQKIWQNVMPKIAQTAKKANRTISHQVGVPWEFFSDGMPSKKFKFKIFKVKRRAKNNYYASLPKFDSDTGFELQTKFKGLGLKKQLPYSYNWPYDFFSLIELGQMETEVTFEPSGFASYPPDSGFEYNILLANAYQDFQHNSTPEKGDET